MQCGDQVSRISFNFLKWRSMGPQKLATIIGHKYSIFKPSKEIKVFFQSLKLGKLFVQKKNFQNFNFLGSWISKIVFILVEKLKFSQYSGRHKIPQIFTKTYYLLSKFSNNCNSESQFCELPRPWAPPFQKIKRNPLNQTTDFLWFYYIFSLKNKPKLFTQS